METVAHLSVAVETCNDDVLETKGRESKVKPATRELDGLDFLRPEVRSELVDFVEKVFVISAMHAALLWFSQSG